MAFAEFLRFNELAKLHPIDLSFDEVTVAIRQSKTYQFRQGDIVVIARTFTATCLRPVKMSEKYMAMGGINKKDTHFLLEALQNIRRVRSCVHQVACQDNITLSSK